MSRPDSTVDQVDAPPVLPRCSRATPRSAAHRLLRGTATVGPSSTTGVATARTGTENPSPPNSWSGHPLPGTRHDRGTGQGHGDGRGCGCTRPGRTCRHGAGLPLLTAHGPATRTRGS